MELLYQAALYNIHNNIIITSSDEHVLLMQKQIVHADGGSRYPVCLWTLIILPLCYPSNLNLWFTVTFENCY